MVKLLSHGLMLGPRLLFTELPISITKLPTFSTSMPEHEESFG